VVRSSVFYDNGSPIMVGAATEHPHDDTGNGCAPDGGLPCDSESLYALFVAGAGDPTHPVANACGSNATNTGISELYPANDNTGCTGIETPFVCCTGFGTGTCRALPNVIPSPTGAAFPPAFDCKSFNPILQTTPYLGAVNPAAGPSCVFTGATPHCD